MNAFNAVVRMAMVGVLMAIAGSVAAQQAYPNKPIRLITPYPPGGATSVVSRLVGQKLTESWGQQVIVDNRGGGNTIIGSEAVAKSPPDGYTLLLVNSALVIIPNLLSAPYDVIKDFAPVATVTSIGLILVLHPSVPASNLQEFIALAKSRPGQLNYASSGSGNSNHLVGELFQSLTGVRIQHVPYKGAGPGLTDLLGGQVQLYFASPPSAVPHIKSGRLKAIAVTGATRLSALPEVPTFTEAGLSDLNADSWQGILAPAGTPSAVIDKLSTEIAKILAMPDIKERLVSQGMAPFISTPEQFAMLLKSDFAKYAKIIKTANIKLDD